MNGGLKSGIAKKFLLPSSTLYTYFLVKNHIPKHMKSTCSALNPKLR